MKLTLAVVLLCAVYANGYRLHRRQAPPSIDSFTSAVNGAGNGTNAGPNSGAANNGTNGATNSTSGGADISAPLFETFKSATNQFLQLQKAVATVAGQFQRIIQSGARIATGSTGGDGTKESSSSDPSNVLVTPVFDAMKSMTNQLLQFQRSLEGVSGQFQRIIQSGAKTVVGGLMAEDGAENRADEGSGVGGGAGVLVNPLLAGFRSVTDQLATLQKSLSGLSGQFSRLVESGSRTITGGLEAEQDGGNNGPSIALPFIDSFRSLNQQLASLQRSLSEINGQFSRLLESGSRTITSGLEAENGAGNGGAVAPFLDGFRSVTNQLAALQRSLSELNGQFSRLIQSGSKIATSGLEAEQNGTTNGTSGATGPQAWMEQSLKSMTEQLSAFQKRLAEINTQFRGFFESGAKLISSGLEAEQGNGGNTLVNPFLDSFRSITDQFSALQRGFQDLSGQFSRILESGSRTLTGGLEAEQPNGAGAGGPGGVPNFVAPLLESFRSLTNQLSVLQRSLTEINGQFSRFLESGSKSITSGVEAENGADGNGGAVAPFLEGFRSFTNQLASLQRSLSELNGQFSRLVESGSKIATSGLEAESEQNGASIALPFIDSFRSLNQQLASLQRGLSELNGQFSRLLESGSRTLTSGLEAEQSGGNSGNTLVNPFFDGFRSLTDQFAVLQKSLSQLSGQVSRMLESGTKTIASGLVADDKIEGPNVGGAILENMSTWTRDLASVQKQLLDMNNRIATMIQTSAKVFGGGLSAAPSNDEGPLIGRADAQLVNELLRVVQRMGSQIGDMSRTLGSAMNGATGMIRGGNGDDGNGGFSNLNPLNAIQRQVNNLGQTFTRIIPTGNPTN